MWWGNFWIRWGNRIDPNYSAALTIVYGECCVCLSNPASNDWTNLIAVCKSSQLITVVPLFKIVYIIDRAFLVVWFVVSDDLSDLLVWCWATFCWRWWLDPVESWVVRFWIWRVVVLLSDPYRIVCSFVMMRNLWISFYQLDHSFEQREHHLIASLTALQMPLKCHMILLYCLSRSLNLMQRVWACIWSNMLICDESGHKSQCYEY